MYRVDINMLLSNVTFCESPSDVV